MFRSLHRLGVGREVFQFVNLFISKEKWYVFHSRLAVDYYNIINRGQASQWHS